MIRQAAMAGRVSCLRYMLPYMRSQGLLLGEDETKRKEFELLGHFQETRDSNHEV